ncbi:uncharacterized protein LOC127261896 [Andrographis paniculata]|uniref:uncharacterized protein LOC127261896 n=1 Tax=Andrographis paniculata TaxID=175694 RepID=UPI0021E8A39D|nr:uncharacterized protein LOC127261896 [Andrographis paniculata]
MRNSIAAARSRIGRYWGLSSRRICSCTPPINHSLADNMPCPWKPFCSSSGFGRNSIGVHFAFFAPRLSHLHAKAAFSSEARSDSATDDSNGEVEPIDSWEEEDEAEPEVGDGGDGGGIVLRNCLWGERALSIGKQVLLEFGEGIELYAFKTSPRGYVYVRLDKLSNAYGCPSMEEIELFNRLYKKKLDEAGAIGEIPDDLALEVSSPGADRLLRVPDDLLRFKEMPMVVTYLQDSGPSKSGVYFLDSIEAETGCCIWKLADVRENRDPAAKGRPLNRKQKDSRLKLPYLMIKQVTLYISY